MSIQMLVNNRYRELMAKNDNDKMDFQPNGMPLEDFGASNNVMRMGPPMYEDSKFQVTDKDVSLEIKF